MKNIFLIFILSLLCSCSVKRTQSSSVSKVEQQALTEQNIFSEQITQGTQTSLTIAKIAQTEYRFDTMGRVSSVIIRSVDFSKKDSTRVKDSVRTQLREQKKKNTVSHEQNTEKSITKPSPVWFYIKIGLLALALVVGLVGFKILKKGIGL